MSRKLTGTGLVLLILTASCAVKVTTDGSEPNHPHHHPAPPPPAAAPAPAAPAPAPAPAAAPAPTQASAVHPVAAGSAGMNVAKILAIKARNPKNCGYMEMAPGNWVHIDCGRYTASIRSIPHLSARKLVVVKAHKTIVHSFHARSRYGGAKPATATATAAGAQPGGGPAQVGEAFPSTIDHRADNVEGPIKNQGGVGSCTAHSLSAALDNAAIRAGDLQPGDHDNMASPLHVWSRYGLPNMGAAADGNIAQPVSVYKNWPQSDKEACELFQDNGAYAADCGETYGVTPGSWKKDPPLVSKYDNAQKTGVYKIASIEKLAVSPPNMDELIGTLASGSDIWSAFTIDGSKWSNSQMTNAVIPDWSDSSGGHAVVISGYRDTGHGKQFLIHNSWGESWGEKGYAWISEAMLTKNLYYAYKVKITNGVKKEDLTDDDCAPDELIDIATGLCAVMCADNSRANNGCKK